MKCRNIENDNLHQIETKVVLGREAAVGKCGDALRRLQTSAEQPEL